MGTVNLLFWVCFSCSFSFPWLTRGPPACGPNCHRSSLDAMRDARAHRSGDTLGMACRACLASSSSAWRPWLLTAVIRRRSRLPHPYRLHDIDRKIT